MTWTPRQAIAVLGGSISFSHEQVVSAFRVGRSIAKHGRVLVTGATTGIPYAAALGAHAEGGLVVGISPAATRAEHVDAYRKPFGQADVMILSGLGTDARSSLIVRSVHGGIFIGGEFGTLGEFCSAWQTRGPKVWGILEGTGGLAGECPRLVGLTSTTWESEIVTDENPEKLVERVCARAEEFGKDLAVDHIPQDDDRVRAMLKDYLASAS